MSNATACYVIVQQRYFIADPREQWRSLLRTDNAPREIVQFDSRQAALDMVATLRAMPFVPLRNEEMPPSYRVESIYDVPPNLLTYDPYR